MRNERGWTYIDCRSKRLSEAVFEDAHSFREGLGVVREGGKYGFVDRLGRLVIASRYGIAHSFWNGKALVGSGEPGALHYIDRYGRRSGAFEFWGHPASASEEGGEGDD